MSENPRVFFDIEVGGETSGRVVMELFADVCPRTAENFRSLCTGEKGLGRSKKPLHFKGCVFHRIIPEFMCQGGDFTQGDGTGGESIYGQTFADEDFSLKHDQPGILSMANAGPNTNGSQFFLCTVPCPWLDGKHVVFGKVVEGMATVKRMEVVGTRTGKTMRRVIIADCGQLPSRMQTLLKLKKEKEELAKLKENPLQVLDPDEASRKRLQEMQAAAEPKRRAAPVAAAQSAGESAGGDDAQPSGGQVAAAPGHDAQRSTASGAGASEDAGGSSGRLDGDNGDEDDAGPADGVDPYAGMNARERKLHELRARLNQCRKANQTAVVAEKKRQKGITDPDAPPDDSSVGAKRRWYEEKKKKRAEELARMGLDPTQAHRLETVEQAELQYAKREKKEKPAGWDIFNTKALYNAYMKRTENVPYTKEDYEAAKARNPELYSDEVDGLKFGNAPALPDGNVDNMVNELTERERKRADYSRRRAFRESKDVDYINDRNAHFNKKIDRAYGKFTEETRANLERGTALPDR